MKLQIDNLDGGGAIDYTPAVDISQLPHITRRLNRAAEMRFSLVAISVDFVIPVNGARVVLGLVNGQKLFTGYLTEPPGFEYLGWGQGGPTYRYRFVARSDEAILDRKRLPDHSPFVARSAGSALRQVTNDLLPGVLDTSGVQELDVLPSYVPDPQKKWSEHAALIGLLARASYRALDGGLSFSPVGSLVHALNEEDSSFCPEGLKLAPADRGDQ